MREWSWCSAPMASERQIQITKEQLICNIFLVGWGVQCPSVPIAAMRLVVGYKAGQDCSHLPTPYGTGCCMLWPMELLQFWSNTLLQRRPLWACTAGRSSWGEGRTKERTGAGHQTGCKDSTRFGRVLECTYFLGLSLDVCLTVHLILSMWEVSQSWF